MVDINSDEIVWSKPPGSYTDELTYYFEAGCVPLTSCYVLVAEDTYGDGMCCNAGYGLLNVTFDYMPVLEADVFGFNETSLFFGSDCPENTPAPTESPGGGGGGGGCCDSLTSEMADLHTKLDYMGYEVEMKLNTLQNDVTSLHSAVDQILYILLNNTSA